MAQAERSARAAPGRADFTSRGVSMAFPARDFQQQRAEPSARSSGALRFAMGLGLIVGSAAIGLWIVDEVFLHFLTRSYIEEPAVVFNLNKNFAYASYIVVFMLVALFVLKMFYFSHSNRSVGFYGLSAIIVAHSLLLWQGTKYQFFDTSGRATKCYILSRDGVVRYLEHAGVDAVTGLPCHELTPDAQERFDQYSKGKLPERVVDDNQDFFERRTGQPIVWYSRTKTGEIELFNLMGFHPQTGEELQPISAPVGEEYKAQRAASKLKAERLHQSPPQRVDPESLTIYDPATGEAQVWYWRDRNGDYEFYDNSGFHPRAGESLKVVDAAIMADWKKWAEAKAARQREEMLRQEKAEKEAAERLELEQQRVLAQEEKERQLAAKREHLDRDASEREERQKLDETARRQRTAQAGSVCDQAAANPSDPRKPSEVPGVRYEELKAHAPDAAEACRYAVEVFPNEPRFKYQYARTLDFIEPDKAAAIYKQLIRQNYPAAYDNLASFYLRKRDIAAAIPILKAGINANDPDSMVTFAELVEHGYVPVQNPAGAKFALLQRAAQLGHQGAQRVLER
jgi:hypothetical protein